MKKRVSLTIDQNVMHRAKQVARRRNTSVSQLVEDSLRYIAEPGSTDGKNFVERWRGKLKLKLLPRDPSDPRREYLWKKYGLAEHADSD